MKKLWGIVLVVALSVLNFSAPAQAVDVVRYYIATEGTASGSSGGSCESPSFVGNGEGPIQAALDLAANSNDESQSYTDVGFNQNVTYTEIILCAGTWHLTETLNVDANVIIKGAGYAATKIDGGNQVRIMNIGSFDPAQFDLTWADVQANPAVLRDRASFAARVQIQDLTLQNGSANSAANEADRVGGAVRILGRDSAHFKNVYFSGNEAWRGAAVYAVGGGGDNFEQVDNSPAGDLIIESSAFSQNIISGGEGRGAVIMAIRYQRDLIGAQIVNSSFYKNVAETTLNFTFTNGRSIGNSFVDNKTNDTPDLAGGGTIVVRGNVLAQNNSTLLCNDQLQMGSDSLSTGACGAADNQTTNATYAEIAPLDLYPADEIPVQRFALASITRNNWPVASNCPTLDALAQARPTTGSCDSGPIQQPDILSAAPELVATAEFSQDGEIAFVTTPPSSGVSSKVTYSSVSSICRVDAASGNVTAHVNGICNVDWAVFTDINHLANQGSTRLVFTVFDRNGGSPGTYLVEHFQGTTYFITTSGIIDRLLPNGEYEAAWKTLQPRDEWAGNTWSSAIDSNGTLYVAYWFGRIATITPEGVVEESAYTSHGIGDIATFGISPNDELYVATCDAANGDDQVFKLSADNVPTKVADLPAGSCASTMAFDTDSNIYLAEWSSNGLLKVSPDGTVTEQPEATGGWTQQLAVDEKGDVYSGTHEAQKIVKLSKTGEFDDAWLTLPNGCKPAGVASNGREGLYVVCNNTKQILEIDTVTKSIIEKTTPQFDTGGFSNARYANNKLFFGSEFGYNGLVAFNKAEQSNISVSSEVDVAETRATLTATGGTGTGSIVYESVTPASCEVAADGTVTALTQAVCKIKASKRGDLNYFPKYSAEYTVSFAAAPASAPALAPLKNVQTPLSAAKVAASIGSKVQLLLNGGSGEGKVVYRNLTPSVCQVDFVGMVTTKASGECQVEVKKAATEKFESATAILSVSVMPLSTKALEHPALLTTREFGRLSTEQIRSLSPEAIGQIRPIVLAGQKVAKLKLLTPAQRKALTKEQLSKLTSAQRKAVGR
ncbi:MAG: hypothetical protein RI933_413 [Actinomycetota bacterium]